MPLHVSSTMCSSAGVQNCIIQKKYLTELINYYQQMHYIAIKITQITVFYVIIRAPTCFDPPGSSSGSSECPY